MVPKTILARSYIIFLPILLCGCVKPQCRETSSSDNPCISLREADDSFTFLNSPIHPSAIREFIPWLSESEPIVSMMDVDAAQRGQHYLTPVTRVNGGFKVQEQNAAGDHETFWYREIGKSPSGIHVLETADSGGGSGIFEYILLIRFECQNVLLSDYSWHRRLVMRCIGVVSLGDRDDGTVTLRGNEIVIGKSRYRRNPISIRLPGAN